MFPYLFGLVNGVSRRQFLCQNSEQPTLVLFGTYIVQIKTEKWLSIITGVIAGRPQRREHDRTATAALYAAVAVGLSSPSDDRRPNLTHKIT